MRRADAWREEIRRLYYGMVFGVNSNIGLKLSRVAGAVTVLAAEATRGHEAAVRDVRVNAGASSADSRALEHGQQRPEDGAECRIYSPTACPPSAPLSPLSLPTLAVFRPFLRLAPLRLSAR